MSPTLNGKVLSWASELDHATLSQAHLTSKMPFMGGHLALMPDAHLGKGATVGSVIATEGAVIPSAVGVDIGCFDRDTEYLSPTGWVKFSEYPGGQVAQYDPSTGLASFVEPLQYIVRDESEFLHFKTKYGIDFAVSRDHKVLAWKVTGRDRRLEKVVLSAQELYDIHNSHVSGADYKIKTGFRIHRPGSSFNMRPELVRLQVMVNADGYMNHRVAQVRLKKTRKIDRAELLLNEAGVEFSKKTLADGVVQFRFVPPSHTKGFGPFWMADLETLVAIADESYYWDGNHDSSCFYTSIKAEADFMSYCYAATGRRSVMREDTREDGSIEYRVFGYTGDTCVGLKGNPKSEITVIPSVDGRSYCFTVPTGFLVARRHGKVFTSGNCGMITLETNLTSESLPDNLDDLHAAISKGIPAGVGVGHQGSSKLYKAMSSRAWDENIDISHDMNKAAAKQLG